MKILFIGPIPPPVTGHSLVDKILLDELNKHHEVEVVNLSKSSFRSGVTSFQRILEIIAILLKVLIKRKADVIYFTISEGIAGNIKDILIYLICLKNISKMIIHLHGGSLKENIFTKNKLLFKINRFFISRLGHVLISGSSHREIFSGIIDDKKVIVIPNFAEDYLFLDESEITRKFQDLQPLKILFLSNLIEGKGYNYLVDAYLGLKSELKNKLRIDFAGGADPVDLKKTKFFEKINSAKEIQYHGFINIEKKKELLTQAHILCFPSYLLEGQGLVILEAYASGCVVITTGQGGIKDVFSDGINGYQIAIKSADSIKQIVETVLKNPNDLLPLAISNRRIAFEKYRSSIFTGSILKIIDKTYHS